MSTESTSRLPEGRVSPSDAPEEHADKRIAALHERILALEKEQARLGVLVQFLGIAKSDRA